MSAFKSELICLSLNAIISCWRFEPVPNPALPPVNDPVEEPDANEVLPAFDPNDVLAPADWNPKFVLFSDPLLTDRVVEDPPAPAPNPVLPPTEVVDPNDDVLPPVDPNPKFPSIRDLGSVSVPKPKFPPFNPFELDLVVVVVVVDVDEDWPGCVLIPNRLNISSSVLLY